MGLGVEVEAIPAARLELEVVPPIPMLSPLEGRSGSAIRAVLFIGAVPGVPMRPAEALVLGLYPGMDDALP